jgi:hypothetical protein
MKICPGCNQSYTDEYLNFCLACGEALTKSSDDAPPTVIMNPARKTDQTNWGNFQQPAAPWQSNPPVHQQQMNMIPQEIYGVNQTLPTVSLVLGILGSVLFCCYGGIPLGAAAVITGYLGMKNADNDPSRYGGRGLAIAGIILGGLAIIGSFFLFVSVFLMR